MRCPTRSLRSKTSKPNTTSPCAWLWNRTSRFSARPIRARFSSSSNAQRAKDEIIKDIRDGTISSRCNLPPEMRATSRAGSQRTPRARGDWNLDQDDGTIRPKEYWPRLQLIGCWKGGTVGIRLKEFARWFANKMPVRDLGYMASEAQMTLPISDSGSAGILAIDENFYEFIPESEIASPAPPSSTAPSSSKDRVLSHSHDSRRALSLRYQRRHSRCRLLHRTPSSNLSAKAATSPTLPARSCT